MATLILQAGTSSPLSITCQRAGKASPRFVGSKSLSFSGRERTSIRGQAKVIPIVASYVSTADEAAIQAAISNGVQIPCSGDILGNLQTLCSISDVTSNMIPGLVDFWEMSFTVNEVNASTILLRYAPGDTITGESFTRAGGAATYYDPNSNVATALANIKRDSHYIVPAFLVSPVRHLLLEDTSKNVCLQSENLGTTWAPLGTPTRVAADHTATGVTLDLIGDDSAAAVEGYEQNIGTFTGNTSKGISLFVRQGTSVSTVIRVQETAGPTNRLFATLTWAGGLPVVTMTTGTYLGYDLLNNAVFRLKFATTTILAANNQQIGIYPATTTAFAVANTGNLHVGGVMAEDIAFCSSYIKTTTVAVTRGADSYSLPFTTPPQEMSVYEKFVERGTIQIVGGRAWVIANAANNRAYLITYAPAGVYVADYGALSGDSVSTLVGASALGDTVEHATRLSGPGAVAIDQSLNAATPTSGGASGPFPLEAAWSGQLVWLCSAGSGCFTALQSFKIVAGARSLDEMRAA